MFTALKSDLGRLLFEARDIRRVHIIGCSRSGTTMLHLAMSYFAKVVLAPDESDIVHPTLSERLHLMASGKLVPGSTYVTKRHYGWFREHNVRRLVDAVRRERIGLVHIVRDPRDVLSSRHAGYRDGQAEYVSAAHWSRSVAAAEQIFGTLEDYPHKLEVRYEDTVLQPDRVQSDMKAAFGLQPHDPTSAISLISRNVERVKADLHPNLTRAVHRIRDMDHASIQRWRTSGVQVLERIQNPQVCSQMRSFLCRYGYDSAET